MQFQPSEDRISIQTPENVAFQHQVAGIGSRFLAALVDSILIVLIQLLVSGILYLAGELVIDNFGEIAGSWLAATLGLLAFGLFWGYYILFETIWNGRSPGKRWVGLRVIKMDGTPINLTESIIRNFIRLIDFLPLNYGVGIVCMFLNKDSRRLGDLAAGTLVVFDQREVSLKDLGQAVRSVPTPAATGIQVDLPVSQLDEDEIQVIELYLRRRNEITPGFDLADQILARCLDKMALAEPPRAGYSSHLWLLEILRQWRQYHQPRESGPGSY